MVLLSTMLTLVRCLIKRVDYRHVWGHADCVLNRCVDDRSMWGHAGFLVKRCLDDRSMWGRGHSDCLVKPCFAVQVYVE